MTKQKRFLESVNREMCLLTAGQLMNTIVWATTPQGHNYWSKVYHLLEEIGYKKRYSEI